jgi:hypothetical protein
MIPWFWRFHVRAVCFAVAALLIFFPSILLADTNANRIISSLDQHYYYPQRTGLTRLVAHVEWLTMDVASETRSYLPNPGFHFIWEKDTGGSRRHFSVTGNSGLLSSEQTNRILHILENYKDHLVPRTLKKKLAKYRGKIRNPKKETINLSLEAQAPDEAIQRYEFLIDSKSWRIQKIQVHQKSDPKKVEGSFKYIHRDGKWLVTESLSTFTLGGTTFSEKTNFLFKKVAGFWLAHKITQTVKRGDRTELSYTFKVKKFEINGKEIL